MGLLNTNEAIMKLLEGYPVALPTETVYGLAAPISNMDALNLVFSIKKRPLTDPLIVHVSSIGMAAELITKMHDDFKALAEHFWPGPLTLVYEKNKSNVPDLITAGLETVALRCPNSDIFLKIIDKTGPLAAPSANIFKSVSPTKAEHVLNELPNADVLEGETSSVGIESTIYDVKNKTVLRPGSITAEEISKVINTRVSYSEKLMTPGSEEDHYQPKQEVWVFEDESELKEKKSSVEFSLLPFRGNPKEAAKHLYQDLRDSDKNGHYIFAYFKKDWKNNEEWFAFYNRLKKASTKWFIQNN